MTTSPLAQTERRYVELAAVSSALLLLFGVTTVMHGVHGIGFSDDGSQEWTIDVPPLWFGLSVLATAAAPLVALRRPWVAVACALLLPLGLMIFSVVLFSAFAGVIATALVLLRRSTWLGLAAAAAGLLLPFGMLVDAVLLVPDGSTITAYGWDAGRFAGTLGAYVVATVGAMVAGLGYRSWAGNAEAQARLEAGQRELSADEALMGERSRLARDLHDVVAHHVSLIAVRAETAPYTVPDLQPAARVVLADIADHSRQALDELRGVLGVLRRADDGPDLTPQPTGADVVRLVEKARAVGSVDLAGATCSPSSTRRAATSPTGSSRRRSPTRGDTRRESRSLSPPYDVTR